METEHAKKLLAELTRAVTEVTLESTSPGRGLTKKAVKREFEAAKAIYWELTALVLTAKEWESISD